MVSHDGLQQPETERETYILARSVTAIEEATEESRLASVQCLIGNAWFSIGSLDNRVTWCNEFEDNLVANFGRDCIWQEGMAISTSDKHCMNCTCRRNCGGELRLYAAYRPQQAKEQ